MRQHTRTANHNHYLKGIVIMTKPDCIADCFDPEVFDAVSRHFTVGYASRYPDHLHLPALTIKGQWLEEAGLVPAPK